MEIWSLVAEYLLLTNPICRIQPRGGCLFACVSKDHKQAVDIALRVNERQFPLCSRPFVISRDKQLRFCKTCPDNFELDDYPTYPEIEEPSLCVRELMGHISWRECTHQVRFTQCLTTVNRAVCGQCYEPAVLDDVTIIQLVHRKDCRGCLHGPPDICNGCMNIVLN